MLIYISWKLKGFIKASICLELKCRYATGHYQRSVQMLEVSYWDQKFMSVALDDSSGCIALLPSYMYFTRSVLQL